MSLPEPGSKPPKPVLEAIGLVKRYGAVVALDSVTVSVGRGECLALVGESGSGKTTLLKSFNRLVQADAGTVMVEGRDAATLDAVELRRSLGYVPQNGGLLPHWPVLRNVGLVPWLRKASDAEERARHALELAGLPEREFGARWPNQLSGGQRQRVALARALAGGAKVLLLDEPFSALDAISKEALQTTFARLGEELALTVVLVTHDLREAFRLAESIAVMRAGRIDRHAPAREIRERPGTPYTRDLFRRAGVA